MLQFQEFDARFAAQFTARVAVRDSLGRRLADSTVSRSVICDTYAESQGATGKVETVVIRFPFKPGSYRREISVTDQFSHREYTSSDSLQVPDLQNTPAISSFFSARAWSESRKTISAKLEYSLAM